MNIDTLIAIVAWASGLWILIMAALITARGVWATLWFKVTPLLLGIALIAIGVHLSGLIEIRVPEAAVNLSATPTEAMTGRPPRVPCAGRLKLDSDQRCMLAATMRAPSKLLPHPTPQRAHATRLFRLMLESQAPGHAG